MAGTTLGTAYVQILPSAKGISKNITEELSGSDGVEAAGKSAGKGLGTSLVGSLKKVVAAAAIGKLVADSLSAGADLQQSFGGVETIYGDAAESMKQMAVEAAAAGISANDYAEQAVSFGASLKQAFGDDIQGAAEAANQAILDMADNSAKMGTDISAIQTAYQGFAKGNYTMLDNLKLGYGGTKEEMERLLEDAEKIHEQTTGEKIDYDISDLGDVYQAIHEVQGELGISGVAAKEASETFSGSMGAMKASATNLLANLALGENIGPSLATLQQTVSTFLVGNFLPMVSNVFQQLPTAFAALPGFVADLIPQILPLAADMVSGLVQGIIDNIPVFVAGFGDLLDAIPEAIDNVNWTELGQKMVDLLAAAWDGAVAIAQDIWDSVTKIFTGEIDVVGILTSAWDALSGIAEGIWSAVTTIFTEELNVVDIATSAWDTLTSTAQSIWDNAKAIFEGAAPAVKSVVTSAWNTVSANAQLLWDNAKEIFEGAAPVVKEVVTTAWDTLSTTADKIWGGVKDIFSNFDIEWPDFGELAKGAFEGLKNAAQAAWDWVKGLFGGGSDDQTVKAVEGTTQEMAATLASMGLKISEVDTSAIDTANEYVEKTAKGWESLIKNLKLAMPSVGTSTLDTAQRYVSMAAGKYQSTMNFKWELPKLHGYLPVISVKMETAKSSDGKTSVSYPTFSASHTKWFAKGGIFNDPTIIGIGDSKGPEAAVPLDIMWTRMEKEFDKHLNDGNGATITNYIEVNGAENPEDWAARFARQMRLEARMA